MKLNGANKKIKSDHKLSQTYPTDLIQFFNKQELAFYFPLPFKHNINEKDADPIFQRFHQTCNSKLESKLSLFSSFDRAHYGSYYHVLMIPPESGINQEKGTLEFIVEKSWKEADLRTDHPKTIISTGHWFQEIETQIDRERIIRVITKQPSPGKAPGSSPWLLGDSSNHNGKESKMKKVDLDYEDYSSQFYYLDD